MEEACVKMGITWHTRQHKAMLEAAGFVDVVEEVYKWPSNTWPRNRGMKEIGMWNVRIVFLAFQITRLFCTSIKRFVLTGDLAREYEDSTRECQSSTVHKSAWLVYARA